MKNYYDTLGVKSAATADEIKRAYRKLASQHHPDKGGDVKKFQEIEEAYRTLSDPEKRSQYDNPQPDFSHFGFQGHGSPFDFQSIFDIFGTRFSHPGQQQQRASHARMTLWVGLDDVARGGRRTISVGTQSGTTAVDIEIPRGIDDGDTVRYPGIGPGGIDIVIVFRIHPHPRWQRQGLNLHVEHTVNVWDLILGAETQVRDVLNTALSLTVPAGTQPGTVLRLRGRGLSSRQGQAGDLLVHIQTQIPKTIAPELLAAIEQYRTPN
jgi:DnaJ-class molecular chaperone